MNERNEILNILSNLDEEDSDSLLLDILHNDDSNPEYESELWRRINEIVKHFHNKPLSFYTTSITY